MHLSRAGTLGQLSRSLLSSRGEASAVSIARQTIDRYGSLPIPDRVSFFQQLAREFGPDPLQLENAWSEYRRIQTPQTFRHLLRAVEPPRQELFRRINRAPGGTSAVVAMRRDLMDLCHHEDESELASVDDDLIHLLNSWFNEGFLVMRRISWSTPAHILERIIRYEAVHTIHGWDDLRRRIQPADRRCYAFFHPSLVDEPLIFVEVALTASMSSSIQELLANDREVMRCEAATMAIFYSISNCQPGLRGISLGTFLIKEVVEELARELPSLQTFVTLSPAPGFGPWLRGLIQAPASHGFAGLSTAPLDRLSSRGWHLEHDFVEAQRPLMLELASAYYLQAKTEEGRPLDAVARFHLGNGARLERLNWIGDTSEKGLTEGAGLMINYLYDLRTIEDNHEAYANDGTVVAAPDIVAARARPQAARPPS